MPDPSWYEVVLGADIEQGDIVRNCPTPVIQSSVESFGEGNTVDVSVSELDLIVLTQSCDIIHEKVNDLLLAEVVSWSEVKEAGEGHVQSTKFREALVQGTVPGYSLLHKAELSAPIPWSLVDFHRLHVLPKTSLVAFLSQAGDRLRMLSPYREHLAQAFARYCMRVGLPHEARTFVSEG